MKTSMTGIHWRDNGAGKGYLIQHSGYCETKKKRIKQKLYSRDQWQEWAYDENFISTLAGLDGIHIFKKRRGGNGLFYSVKSMHVLSIEKYFDCLGWEVYTSGKAGNRTLYIKAREEEK